VNNKVAISALQREIDRLERERDEAVKKAIKEVSQPFTVEITDLRASITQLKGEELSVQISKPYSGRKRGRKPKLGNSYGYPKEGAILFKLIYILKHLGRFSTIKEIADYAKTYEPPMPIELLREKFTKHTYKYKLKGFIDSYQIRTKRNTVYGLPQWIIDGKVVEGREHDPEALIDKLPDEDEQAFERRQAIVFPEMNLDEMFK
jgi:hypothetical protein